MKPLSVRPRRNSAIGRADCVSLNELRKPITGIGDCCARAASGHAAAAPPRADMNCRRPMSIVICPVLKCPSQSEAEYHALIGGSVALKSPVGGRLVRRLLEVLRSRLGQSGAAV